MAERRNRLVAAAMLEDKRGPGSGVLT